MSRDRCSFFAYNLSGKHFSPTSCGVIRNQRSKIRRSNITLTAGCPFRKISKFECRVIKHARYLSTNDASTDSPFLGTYSDKVKGQSDTFLTAGSVLYLCMYGTLDSQRL